MFPEKEQTDILRTFPHIELSYETITHKKVFACQFAFAIPLGKKFFAWFSKYNGSPVCIFLEISSENNGIQNINVEKVSANPLDLHSDLYNGTIFYGTVFQDTTFKHLFSIENVFYIEGKNVSHKTLDQKLMDTCKLISTKKSMFQTPFCNTTIFFGLPLIFPNFTQEMNAEIQNLPYKISGIQFHCIDRPKNHYTMKYEYRVSINRNTSTGTSTGTNINRNTVIVTENKANRKDVIFMVKPDLQNDIYHLYAFDEITQKEFLYDTAYISDYKTSVMMNGLFRNIKENVNLDALEESDDEEEFENDKIDKFVDLKKSLYMTCLYNHKFKKWMPTRLHTTNTNTNNNIKTNTNNTNNILIKKNDLIRLEKNKY